MKNSTNTLEIGTSVVMVDCAEAKKHQGKVWKTRSHPWEVCGELVVLLEGKAGGFAVSNLKVVSEVCHETR